jgi:hypothetical protein
LKTKQTVKLFSGGKVSEDQQLQMVCMGIQYKEYRDNAGRSLKWVSKKLGLSTAVVSLFERGLYAMQPGDLRRLEKILEVPKEESAANEMARSSASVERVLRQMLMNLLAKYLPFLSQLDAEARAGLTTEEASAIYMAEAGGKNKLFYGESLTPEELIGALRLQIVALYAELHKTIAERNNAKKGVAILMKGQKADEQLRAFQAQEHKKQLLAAEEENKSLRAQLGQRTSELENCKATVARIAKQTRSFGEPE